MNLPEYRKALELATREFHDRVAKAAAEYEEAVSAACNQFFNEQDKVKAADPQEDCWNGEGCEHHAGGRL